MFIRNNHSRRKVTKTKSQAVNERSGTCLPLVLLLFRFSFLLENSLDKNLNYPLNTLNWQINYIITYHIPHLIVSTHKATSQLVYPINIHWTETKRLFLQKTSKAISLFIMIMSNTTAILSKAFPCM